MKLTPSEQIPLNTEDYDRCFATIDNAYFARNFLDEVKEYLSDLTDAFSACDHGVQALIEQDCKIDLSLVLQEAADGKMPIPLLLKILQTELAYQSKRLRELSDRAELESSAMLRDMDPADRQEYMACPHQPDD